MLIKTKILGLMLATAVVLTSPVMVYAENGAGDKDSWHQDGDRHHGQKDQMMAKVLNLSDDQVKQMKDSWEKQKTDMKSLFEQMKSSEETLNVEILKATPDMNKVNDIETQLKGLQSQMVDNHLNSILAIKKIMTPEQFVGFMALKKERRMMMHEGHGKFGHKHWGDKKDKAKDSDD